MNYPKQLKTRKKIDALTGIKSSLDHIRSVISLVYLLYIANERKASVRYSISEGSKIKITPELLNAIEEVLGRKDLEATINANPLVTNQYEPLYVGVTLLLKLGYLKMEGRQNTAERTGGVRYPKQLYFANNTLVLDLILQGIPENIQKQSLYEWLQNSKASNQEFEERVCKFITTCTFLTQFKLRDNNNSELFFQTEGIYKALAEGEGDVIYSDSHEFVGPTRIYNNVLKEDLEPWIGINKSILNLKGNTNPDAESISQMLSTTLDIYNVKDDSSMFEDDEEEKEDCLVMPDSKYPLQQIFYGAPGTGKSHEINRLTEGKNVVRTTFHPDTDYSTFVGCYKPHMEEVEMTAVIGETLKVVKDEKGNPRKEKRIVYKYSCQAFLQAYIDAWQQPEQEHYLVIEEINRGNCAQIFGDIFQLLDRNEEGFSSYPIKTDTDAENELMAVFQEKWTLADDKAQEIDNLYRKHYPNGITKDIKNGCLLLLPSNLYIWATMNTSDQSLFPIDSAFKRRWDWKYIKISKGRDADTKELLNWIVKFKFTDEDKQFTFECSWWDFIQTINEKIASATSSDDKKLGYFFCKPKTKGSKEIDSETFVGKVVFYLWNDVFKDEENPIFKVTEGKANPSFDDFYTENGSGKTIADTAALRTFMHNVFGEQSSLFSETEVKAE